MHIPASGPAQPSRLVQFLQVHWRLVSKSMVSLCHQAHRRRWVDDAEECWVCNLVAAVRRGELAVLLLLLWVAGTAQGCQISCHAVVVVCGKGQGVQGSARPDASVFLFCVSLESYIMVALFSTPLGKAAKTPRLQRICQPRRCHTDPTRPTDIARQPRPPNSEPKAPQKPIQTTSYCLPRYYHRSLLLAVAAASPPQ